MFICIELDEVNLKRWNELDSALAENVGLTHRLIGVDRSDSKTIVSWRMPETLYCTNDKVTDCKGLGKLVAEQLSNLFPDGGWKYVVTLSTSWYVDAKKYKASIADTTTEPDLEAERD
jgi:hypothetical protein